ncbi:DUF1822 family protein [Chamaesiphon polymorphus]|uniref:DUF1822 domain-containing protein n=1 Tax=Chamaesiphon polymorphus CCALA 037 TaxID=2107692 RepID=A0A2T1G8B7_9CYAN|nr:DUF1822 family protein [Chamaesiphon polymorphus]PSB53474.1 hypothetical protein C7B77_19530 [Chamaesiphon polymorphus CCALA 037]
MKNRKTLIIEGSSDRLEQILALFETGELDGTPELKILDVGIIATNCAAIKPVDLYRVWLDSLWSKGFQPAVRSSQATSTNKKIVRFQNISIEIVMTIVPLADLSEIQIFLQIRPVDGKGYLPAGLKVAILDELNEVILQKSTRDRSNLLDLTEDGDLICQLEDSFKLSLMLGDESVVESFPR